MFFINKLFVIFHIISPQFKIDFFGNFLARGNAIEHTIRLCFRSGCVIGAIISEILEAHFRDAFINKCAGALLVEYGGPIKDNFSASTFLNAELCLLHFYKRINFKLLHVVTIEVGRVEIVLPFMNSRCHVFMMLLGQLM